MKRILFGIIFLLIIFMGCSLIPNTIDYNTPFYGNINTYEIPFDIKGIIFVRSSETIDGIGNHTGSKITHEMLILEAQKAGADDIINIRIDVNVFSDAFNDNGYVVTKTTYNYTASALAIKYTNTSKAEKSNSQDLESMMNITKKEKRINGFLHTAAAPKNSNSAEKTAFPSAFIGTWKRDDYDNTLTFTANNIISTSSSIMFNLVEVSDDLYTINNSSNTNSFMLTIKSINGNIEISGGVGTGQGNWNGVWKKQ